MRELNGLPVRLGREKQARRQCRLRVDEQQHVIRCIEGFADTDMSLAVAVGKYKIPRSGHAPTDRDQARERMTVGDFKVGGATKIAPEAG